MKQKEKLSSHQIRKYFQEKRKKPKENESASLTDMLNIPREIIICKYSDGFSPFFLFIFSNFNYFFI